MARKLAAKVAAEDRDEEGRSGAKTDRAQLRRLLDQLAAGDVLTVNPRNHERMRAARAALERAGAKGTPVDYQITPAGLDIAVRGPTAKKLVTFIRGKPDSPAGGKVWPVRLWVTNDRVEFRVQRGPDDQFYGFREVALARSKVKGGNGLDDEFLEWLINDAVITTCDAQDLTIYIEAKADYYKGIVNNPARDLNALADELGYTSFEQAKKTLERGAPKTAREKPARATAEPRPEPETTERPAPETRRPEPEKPRPEPETAPAAPHQGDLRKLAANAVFGKIPPQLRTTRGYTKKDEIPSELLSDPEIVAAAKEIDHANRRTKITTLPREVAEEVRFARRIVKYDRDRRQKSEPPPP